MITIDDIGSKITFKELQFNEHAKPEFMQHFIFSGSAYDNRLPLTYASGGRFYEMICSSEEVYKAILAEADQIETDKYGFFLCEMPLVRLDVSNKKKLKILEFSSLTGKVYYYGKSTGYEIDYFGEKYMYWFENLYTIEPVRWIIDTRYKKIISANPLGNNIANFQAHKSANGYYRYNAHITEKRYKKGEPFNINNSIFIIDNGVLKNAFLEDYHFDPGPDYPCFYPTKLPEGITRIDRSTSLDMKIVNPNNPNYYVCFGLPSSLDYFEHGYNLRVNELSIFAKTKVHSPIEVRNKICVHYKSFKELETFFLNSYVSGKVDNFYNKNPIYIYGPKLTKQQMDILKQYAKTKIKWKKGIYNESNDNEENTVILSEQKDSNIGENTTSEKNELQLVIEKLKSYYKYYNNSQEKIDLLNNEVSNYNTEFDELKRRFSNKEKILISPKELYNNFLNKLKLRLSLEEDKSELFKIIHFIDQCIMAFVSNVETDNEFIILLSTISKPILSYLKEQYSNSFKERILELLNDERKNIVNLLDACEKSTIYNNVKELERHLRKNIQLILFDISKALKDENTRRNIVQEIMDNTFKTMELDYKKTKVKIHDNYVSMLIEAQNSLEEKIPNSPFSEVFKKDMEVIKEYIENIEKIKENPDLKRELYSKCECLKEYIAIEDSFQNTKEKQQEKTESEQQTEQYTETQKSINTIITLILVIKALERKVDESIENQKNFELCRVRL